MSNGKEPLRRATTRVRRETASGYLKQAGIAVRVPGWWGRAVNPAIECPPTGATDREPANEVSTDSAPGRVPIASACEPYRTRRSAAAVGLMHNAVTIYQNLVTRHGVMAKYGSLRRCVRTLRGDLLSLWPLPIEPVRYYEWGTRTVHVEVAGAHCKAPPGRIGARILRASASDKHRRTQPPVDRDVQVLVAKGSPQTPALRSRRCPGMCVAVATVCAIVALLLLCAKASAEMERLIGEAGETIGFLQREGGKTFVKDRCFQTLGYVTRDGAFTDTGIKKARSPFPYLLLESERNCARNMPRR